MKRKMRSHERRGFNIEIHEKGERYSAAAYRKGKLIRAVRNDNKG
jgi:hypothetical protein